MKTIWKWLAWIFFLCGLGSYLIAWAEFFTSSVFFGITNSMLFYDAIAAGIFGLFFLAWGSINTTKK